MTNIGSILDQPFNQVNFPKLPVGTYAGVVMGLPVYGESAKKRTKFIEFQIKLYEALEDVDQEALEEFGSIANVQMPLTFYYENEYGYRRLTRFLENCGLDLGDYTNATEASQDVTGKTVGVSVKHENTEVSVRARLDETVRIGE